MDGREIIFMNSTKENNFLAMPDYNVKADLIYICSPNNPTGAAYNRDQLKKWVEYAKEIGLEKEYNDLMEDAMGKMIKLKKLSASEVDKMMAAIQQGQLPK